MYVCVFASVYVCASTFKKTYFYFKAFTTSDINPQDKKS